MKLSKPTWREWMDIFVNGKYVSERNVVINDEEPTKTSDNKWVGPLADILGEDEEPEIIELIDKLQHHPVYSEFLQYICMIGPLNLNYLDK